MKSGIEIIEAKDNIHRYWFEVTTNKRVDGGDAYIPKEPMDRIIAEADTAVGVFVSCAPDDELWRAEDIRASISRCDPIGWMTGEEEINGIQHYTTSQEWASELVMTHINVLANLIHHAGFSLLERTGEFCGCVIMEGEDLSSVNKGVLQYCRGTLRLDHPRGTILPPGNKVEHRPGAASSHSMTAAFEETEEDGYDVKVHYTESGDEEWELRQGEVVDFMRRMGMQCEYGKGEDGLSATCKGLLNDEQILDLALLISQLKDIDLLPAECVGLAIEEALAQSAKLKKLSKDDLDMLWDLPWCRAGNNPQVLDCQHERANKYAERREARREETAKEAFDSCYHTVVTYRAAALNGSCEGRATRTEWTPPFTTTPYWKLAEAEQETSRLSTYAGEVEDITGDASYHDIVDNLDTDNIAAAMALVSRCPPEEALRLAIESTPMHLAWRIKGFIENIASVVKMAGDAGYNDDSFKQALPEYYRWADIVELTMRLQAADEYVGNYLDSVNCLFNQTVGAVKRNAGVRCGYDPYENVWSAFRKTEDIEKQCGGLEEVYGEYKPEAVQQCRAVWADAEKVSKDAAIELLAQCSADKALEDTILRYGTTKFAIDWRLGNIVSVCSAVGDPCAEKIGKKKDEYFDLPSSAWPLPEYVGEWAGVEL